MLKVNFEEMKEHVKQAIIESSVEGHVDLEDLTNNLLNLYIKIKREELRKILRGKCVTDNACEVAIDKILNLHSVSDCQFERYAEFCIECDRKGMKPLKYKDYLEIG